MDKADIHFLFNIGSVDFYELKHTTLGFLLSPRISYLWKMNDLNDYHGPFETLYQAVNNYQAFQALTNSQPITLATNVIPVNFKTKKRIPISL